jgi:L-alanine-DL-glutamate epimerase-like enolase superfamily enzyme
MKIARIETYATERVALVRVLTDDGAEGFGQIPPPKPIPPVEILHTIIAPHFLGKNPWHIQALVHECLQQEYKFLGTFLYRALCGIDTAIYDLLGQVTQQPVCNLLGGKLRAEVPVYASRLTRDTTPEAEVERLLAAKSAGFRAAKIKIGGRMGADIDALPNRSERLIRLAREKLGADFALCADGNSGYTRHGAIKIGRVLEECGFYHFEEPCPFYDLDNMVEIAAALDIPVAGGEQDNSLPHLQRMIQQRAVDIIQCDVGYVGGITRARKVAEMAEVAGIPFTPHCANRSMLQLFTLHLTAAMPACHMFQEYAFRDGNKEQWSNEIYEPFPVPINGSLPVPDKPGWGVTILPEFLKKATLRASTPKVKAEAQP